MDLYIVTTIASNKSDEKLETKAFYNLCDAEEELNKCHSSFSEFCRTYDIDYRTIWSPDNLGFKVLNLENKDNTYSGAIIKSAVY